MECPEIHPDLCDNGHEMHLKFTVKDTQYKQRGTPFYVCDCKPAHFRDPDKGWTKPERSGGNQPQSQPQSQRPRVKVEGESVKIAKMQFCCTACGAMNDLEVTAYATGTYVPESQPQQRPVEDKSYPRTYVDREQQNDPRRDARR